MENTDFTIDYISDAFIISRLNANHVLGKCFLNCEMCVLYTIECASHIVTEKTLLFPEGNLVCSVLFPHQRCEWWHVLWYCCPHTEHILSCFALLREQIGEDKALAGNQVEDFPLVFVVVGHVALVGLLWVNTNTTTGAIWVVFNSVWPVFDPQKTILDQLWAENKHRQQPFSKKGMNFLKPNLQKGPNQTFVHMWL